MRPNADKQLRIGPKPTISDYAAPIVPGNPKMTPNFTARATSGLASTIGSLFKDGLSEDEVQSVIAQLQAKGHIVVNQEKVSYNLRRRR